jgi:hypothetical protein
MEDKQPVAHKRKCNHFNPQNTLILPRSCPDGKSRKNACRKAYPSAIYKPRHAEAQRRQHDHKPCLMLPVIVEPSDI